MHSLSLPSFVPALNQNKAINPLGCFMHWSKYTCLWHLVYFLLTLLFQVYRDWLARYLLRWYAGIHLDMVIWLQELANPFKDIWVLMQDHFLAYYQLGYLSLDSWCLSGHFLLCCLCRHFLFLCMSYCFCFLQVIC